MHKCIRILGNAIIGRLFLEKNLTGNWYLDMLEETIYPLITHELETEIDAHGNLLLQEDQLHFQQDGASSHYFRPVRQWLNEGFPDGWIDRRGAIGWPPRSPDVTPIDFFFGDILNSLCIKHHLLILMNLKDELQQHATQFVVKFSEIFESGSKTDFITV